MLTIKRVNKKEAVYDITVEGNENFFANDMLVHNCTEINLPTKPLEHIHSGATRKRVKVKKEHVAEFKKHLETYNGIAMTNKRKK